MRRTLFLIALLCLALVLTLGCQSNRRQPTAPQQTAADDASVESAKQAYRAYVEGDCSAVERTYRSADVSSWGASEIRHSFDLLEGFCRELENDISGARETYREIVRNAPLSFASDDARERLRVLRRVENDPNYRDWILAAADRVATNETPRPAVDRVPVGFPPLAQRAGVGGYAVVEFGVTPRGDTDAPIVVDSNPPLIFDGVALRAVREWRYSMSNDDPKTRRQAIRLVFQPEDGDSGTVESTVK